MESEQSTHNQTSEEQKTAWYKHRAFLFGVIPLFVFLLLGGTAITVSETYHKERIFHGVSVGPLDIGGLKKDEAFQVLETWHDQWWSNEMRYEVYDEQGKKITAVSFLPIIVTEGAGQSVEFIEFDIQQMLENAYAYGRSDHILDRIISQLQLVVSPQRLDGVVRVDEEQLQEVLSLELAEYETLPVNATFEFNGSKSEPIIISESEGNTFDYALAISQTVDSLKRLDTSHFEIRRSATEPDVYTADVKEALTDYDTLEDLFPLVVSYHDPKIDFERDWRLTWREAQSDIKVIQYADGDSVLHSLGFDADAITSYLERIEADVNREAKDAKFSVGEDGKVEQFQPSQDGYEVLREETIMAINQAIVEELNQVKTTAENEDEPADSVVELAVNIYSPEIPTGEVNDLGITEVLGVGYSNFSGSPRNRVHNISVGVDKLNGLLIAPDEEFSLLAALKPFTISGGYLPELVIKGDKIEPEVGGGLCQIGSTTFRAAMKSGLEIVERRNHSLVVSYYNDPRNGNPGTDATIYDSSPDFKFKNDTGNYILIQTSMNAANGDLFFTFWGTSDGRTADYTEPVVHRWIGTGPTKTIESDDLAPGQRRCQGAHPGAETSFTYTVTRPDGEVEETVYNSSYRPLPTICLVGPSTEAGDGSVENSDSDVEISDSTEQAQVTQSTPQEDPQPAIES